MKIGILSDSHSKIEATRFAIKHLAQEGVDYLVHAGDLCLEENIDLLHKSKIPYVAVFGNNDHMLLHLQNSRNIHKEPYYFKIQSTTFKLMHLPFYMTPDSHVVISGHTHMFEHHYKNGTLFINPGEICAREKPLIEFVCLDISDKAFVIQYFSSKSHTSPPSKKEFVYRRDHE